MIIRYSPQALEDMQLIKEYISETLQNPVSANKIVASINKTCSMLESQPKLGMALSAKINRETDLQYIISGVYLIFYRIDEQFVSVIRVLDGRTNYMQALFGTL